jgi:type II secretory ATPase GspE/PulE/Tfp pilus assembly ATPase PilB-like protein
VSEIVAASKGMRTLKQDGIDKALRGLTDLQQVHTV